MSTLDKGRTMAVADAKEFFERELKKLKYEIFARNTFLINLYDHATDVFADWGIKDE